MTFHITPAGNAAQCKARKGNCPFGGESEHFTTKEEAVQAYETRNANATIPSQAKPVSTSLLQNSSFEVGYGARAYFRLLNHQDYTQAKALHGKVKDQNVIDAVKDIHRAESQVTTLEEQREKTLKRLDSAKTVNQKEGYKKAVTDIEVKLTKALSDYDDAKVVVDKLKAKYAKELAIHNNSLKALERLANSKKPIDRPVGIEGRIENLKETLTNVKPIQPISKIMDDGQDSNKIAAAAEAYGVPHYAESARRLRDAIHEEEELLKKRVNLEELEAQATTPRLKKAVEEDLAAIDKSIHHLQPTIKAEEPRVALFKDEIRDRQLHENAIRRELNALLKIELRTRP